MESDRVVTIENVQVLQDTGLVLKCGIGKRVVEIPKLMIRGLAPLPGQQGLLEVLEWFAIEKRLLD